MRRLLIVPSGWPCALRECPPGPFIDPDHPENLCFKSEYGDNDGKIDAFNAAGEYYTGTGPVQPVEMVAVDEEVG